MDKEERRIQAAPTTTPALAKLRFAKGENEMLLSSDQVVHCDTNHAVTLDERHAVHVNGYRQHRPSWIPKYHRMAAIIVGPFLVRNARLQFL